MGLIQTHLKLKHQNYLQAVADKIDELEELRLRLTGEQSIDFW